MLITSFPVSITSIKRSKQFGKHALTFLFDKLCPIALEAMGGKNVRK